MAFKSKVTSSTAVLLASVNFKVRVLLPVLHLNTPSISSVLAPNHWSFLYLQLKNIINAESRYIDHLQ